jgi:hypothetical protein
MPQLFYEDIYAALGEIVRATGGMKVVGAAMRPELDAVAAAGWLKDCLNPARREKLDPLQIVWLLRRGRIAGVHDAMAYISQEVGYENPRPISTEEIFLTALDDLKSTQERMAQSAALIQRLTTEHPELLGIKRKI